MFAFILLSSFTSFKEGEIPLTFILVAVFFIGQQVVEGITVQDNISNLSHIIGEIVGGLMGYGLNVQTQFDNKKGEAYLECHHVVWIARGGADEVFNAVALCPNCHRKMHILDEKDDVDYLMKVAKE